MLHCPTCGRHYPEGVLLCREDATPLQADSTIAQHVPADPMIGRTLDNKYRLDERLGEGGMGTVYRATHLLIDRPVAVKVLNMRFVEDDAAQERFRREARAAGRLQHINAVAVTDFGSTVEGTVYLVMELLEGSTLREVLNHEAPLETSRAISLMLQISAAVAAAHEAGVIHRDLKPANIFIVQHDEGPPVVKVLDFGIAKLASDSVEDLEQKALTQTGVMIGTPRYMSPEQCDGAKLTPAADVYSLGIIFYEMLTATTPFSGSSPLAVALKHSSQPPAWPTSIVASIPPRLEQVVLRALEKNPADRPGNAALFRQELLQIAAEMRSGSPVLNESKPETFQKSDLGSIHTSHSPGVKELAAIAELPVVRPEESTIPGYSAENAVRRSSVIADQLPKAPLTEKPLSRPQGLPAPHHRRFNVSLKRNEKFSEWLKSPVGTIAGLVATLAVLLAVFIGAPRRTTTPAPQTDQAAVPTISPVGANVATPADTNRTDDPSPLPGAGVAPGKRAEYEASRIHRDSPRRKPVVSRPQQRGSKLGSVVGEVKKVRKKIFRF